MNSKPAATQLSRPRVNQNTQETLDEKTLQKWRQAIEKPDVAETLGYKKDELESTAEYLDEYMPDWRLSALDVETAVMCIARGVVGRYNERGNVLPKISKKPRTEDERVQMRDVIILGNWKNAQMDLIRMCGNRGANIAVTVEERKLQVRNTQCLKTVCNYLDQEMPGWSNNVLVREAINIANRYQKAGNRLPRSVSLASSQL